MSDSITPLFQAWRRPRGQHHATWEKVEGCSGATAGAVFTLIGDLELKAAPDQWDWVIMPEGQTPAVEAQKYRTRQMMPGGGAQ